MNGPLRQQRTPDGPGEVIDNPEALLLHLVGPGQDVGRGRVREPMAFLLALPRAPGLPPHLGLTEVNKKAPVHLKMPGPEGDVEVGRGRPVPLTISLRAGPAPARRPKGR
jgi:hypothetical protein